MGDGDACWEAGAAGVGEVVQCSAGAATVSTDPSVSLRSLHELLRGAVIDSQWDRPWNRLLPWPEGAVVAPPALRSLSRREGRPQSVVDAWVGEGGRGLAQGRSLP